MPVVRPGLAILAIGISSLSATGCDSAAVSRRAAATASSQADPAPEATRLLAQARQEAASGSLDAAATDAARAFDLRTRVLGNGHPATEEAAVVLASVFLARHRRTEAASLFRDVLGTRMQRVGSASPELLEALDPLIDCLLSAGEFRGAEPLARQAADIRERWQGAGHADHVQALLRQAMIERSLCLLPQAEAAAARAVELLRHRPSVELLPAALDEYAAVREAQQRPSEARTLIAAAAEADSRRDEIGIRRQRDRLLRLADKTAEEGKPAEAIPIIEKALVLESAMPVREFTTAWKLAWLWYRAGDEAKALEAYQRYGVVEYELPATGAAGQAQLSSPSFLRPPVPSAEPVKRSREACVPRVNAPEGKANDVARVVAGMRGGFRNCYNRALATDPSLSLTLRLTGVIDAAGNVTRVSTISQRSIPAALPLCLMEVLRSSRFEPPEGGSATVVIPVTLVQER